MRAWYVLALTDPVEWSWSVERRGYFPTLLSFFSLKTLHSLQTCPTMARRVPGKVIAVVAPDDPGGSHNSQNEERNPIITCRHVTITSCCVQLCVLFLFPLALAANGLGTGCTHDARPVGEAAKWAS